MTRSVKQVEATGIDWTKVADVLLSGGVGLAGLWLAKSYRSQIRVSLATRRFDSYSRLWDLTQDATPSRIDQDHQRPSPTTLPNPLSPRERHALFTRLQAWYYSQGNGILLSKDSRAIFLAAKNNLVCSDAKIEPKALRTLVCDTEADNLSDEARGLLSIRQLSLLRSQLKSDLAIYGVPYVSTLKNHERAFLMGLRLNLLRRPWRYAIKRKRIARLRFAVKRYRSSVDYDDYVARKHSLWRSADGEDVYPIFADKRSAMTSDATKA